MTLDDVVHVSIPNEHDELSQAVERGEALTNEQARTLKRLMWEQTQYFQELAAERYVRAHDAEYKLKRIRAYVVERLGHSQIDRPLAVSLARIHTILEGE